MSRLLISTMDAAGHVHPAIPIATALVEDGHEVLWHTWPAYADAVAATGARLVVPRSTPSFADLPPTPDPALKGPAAGVDVLRKLMVDRVTGQLADYERVLDEHGFDAILVDLCALGGRVLHERRGVPWATLGISPLTMPSPDIPPYATGRRPPSGWPGRLRNRVEHRLNAMFLRGVTTAYNAVRVEAGLPPAASAIDHMISDQLHLQAATPLIEYPRRPWPSHVHLVGPLLPPAPVGTRLPPWWDELDQARVVVHVTQGTVATEPDLLVRPTLLALADLDGLVVATTPDPDALGPLPANARVARFVPHPLLLPKTTVMVSNGGYNGVKAALANGVPLVIAPWGNDQPDVAGRIAWAGAAINLRTRTPGPAAIADAVRAVLARRCYHDAAAAIAAEFARYPDGAHAAELLAGLALRPVADGLAGTRRSP